MVMALLCEEIMSAQLKAIKKTAGMFAVASIAVILVVGVLTSISAEVVAWILLSMVLGYCIWVVYKINLSQIQYEEKLKDITEK